MFGTERMGIGMGWGGLWMIAIWLIPIVLVVLLLRWFDDRRREPSPRDEGDARHILDARFARGDIDAAEYEERKRALDT
ncbi:MAG: SHOCT domain-containing protein [Thiohalocapsa sp.]